MVEVLQVIFYLICICVMSLTGNMLFHSRKLIKRQQEVEELRIKKLKSEMEVK